MNTIASFRLCKLTDEELLEKVDKMTDEMFQKREIPLMTIPARPDEDYDLLVGELILRFGEMTGRNKGLKDKVIECFKENCQHPQDTEGYECRLCVRWVGNHCKLMDGFVEKLGKIIK